MTQHIEKTKKMEAILELIKKERERQIIEKEYDAKHDDIYNNHEIIVASVVYLTASINEDFARNALSDIDWDITIKTDDYEDNLIKAGALIVAELQRLGRLKK